MTIGPTGTVAEPGPVAAPRHRRLAAAWLAATAALLLFLVPLLLANVPYQDDTIRSLFGQLFWDNVGRQGALWATRILTVSDGVDPWPMTLVGAAASMAAALVAASHLARGRPDPAFIVASGTVFTSPFLLQNMSYRFDCLSMGIAASCAVAAASLALDRPQRTLLTRTALLALLLFSYQPALGLYAGFALLLLSDRLLRGGRAALLVPELARCARAFVLPAVLSVGYALAFPHLTTGDAGRGALSLSAIGRNLHVLRHVTAVLLGRAEWMMVAVAGLAVLGAVLRRAATVPVAVVLLLATAAAYVACLGPNLVLRAPPPGVRVLMGFQAPLAIVLLILFRVGRPAFVAATVALLLWNVSFCCRYGNFLSTETRSEDLVLSHLSYDLGRLRAEHGVQRAELVDALPRSPVIRTMLSRMPSLGLVAQEPEMRWIAELRLAALTDGVALGQSCPLAETARRRGAPTLTEAAGDYTIRVYGPDAVVEFGTRALTGDACP
ncbi:MAG: glucosyltransferase domain-containing protein [Gluconacetobacter diazotrophicus]|nr:glucosyltransferase domain-containing protein [Gluconacetobacter diazotrophicus]